MMQCKDCQFFRRNESGDIAFACDPFGTVIEPECLVKWQLIKINQMVSSYQATLEYYRKLAPMQEKMFRVMEREMDDMSESEKWKISEEGENDAPFAPPPDEDDWGQAR